MSDNLRKAVSDDNLDNVVGGLMVFHYDTKVLDYTSPDDGHTGTYDILQYERAWNFYNKAHALNWREDDIIAKMLSEGMIKVK